MSTPADQTPPAAPAEGSTDTKPPVDDGLKFLFDAEEPAPKSDDSSMRSLAQAIKDDPAPDEPKKEEEKKEAAPPKEEKTEAPPLLHT